MASATERTPTVTRRRVGRADKEDAVKDKITYTTAGGGTVKWKQTNDGGIWNCEACGDKDSGYPYEANDHASGCWAR